MNKRLILVLITVLLVLFESYTEDIFFEVINDSNLYESSKVITRTIPYGEKVKAYTSSGACFIGFNGSKEEIFFCEIETDDNKNYQMVANDLAPWETESLIDPALLIDFNSADRKSFIVANTTTLLSSLERETILNYEPFWNDPANLELRDDFGKKINWFDYYTEHLLQYGAQFTILTNSYIRMSYYQFALLNISEIENGYVFTTKFANDAWKWDDNEIPLDFGDLTDENTFNLIMIVDGDYLDFYLGFYLEHESQKLASAVSVNQEFIQQLITLMKTNTADLSHIIWPTRADGSMDYPIPSNVLLQNFIPTHLTLSETALYSEDSPASEKTSIAPNTPLRWIGTGTEGRIKVLTPNREEGWVQLENLKNVVGRGEEYRVEVAPEPVIVETKEELSSPVVEKKPVEEEPVVEETEVAEVMASDSMDMRLVYALVAGVVLFLVLVILLLRKKKK